MQRQNDDGTGNEGPSASRRRFLRAASATVVGAGVVSGAASGQVQTYRFNADEEGWHGEYPKYVLGRTNPVLTFRNQTFYRVSWENLDGKPHAFAIQDEEGNTLVRTDEVSKKGRNGMETFNATEEMATYVDLQRPEKVNGDVQIAERSGQIDNPNVGEIIRSNQSANETQNE